MENILIHCKDVAVAFTSKMITDYQYARQGNDMSHLCRLSVENDDYLLNFSLIYCCYIKIK